MFLTDGVPFRKRRFRIFPAMTDVVGGDWTVVVEVSLVVWDQNRVEEVLELRCASTMLRELGKIAREQSEARAVVAFGARVGYAIRRIVRQNQSEVVGLHFLVA